MQPGAGTVFDQGRHIGTDAAAVQAMVFLADNLGDKFTRRLGETNCKPVDNAHHEMFFIFVIHLPSVIGTVQNVKKIWGALGEEKAPPMGDRQGFRCSRYPVALFTSSGRTAVSSGWAQLCRVEKKSCLGDRPFRARLAVSNRSQARTRNLYLDGPY